MVVRPEPCAGGGPGLSPVRREPGRQVCEGAVVDTQRRNKILVWAVIVGLVASMGLGVLLSL